MRPLSALDARLLDLESPTAAGHVGTLVGLDTRDVDGGWGPDRVRALLESRLPTVAPLTQRLVGGPLGLGGRYLVDDPHFDLEFHVRELGLPEPGTTQQLAEQVAGLHARPLDRRRPLWELYLITGREDGTAAVYAKVHRTLIDETSGTELLHALLDLDEEPRHVGTTEPETTPAGADLLRAGLRSLVTDPRRLGYAVPESLHRLRTFSTDAGLPGGQVVTTLAGVADRLLGPRLLPAGESVVQAPRTRLDAPLTPHRRVAYGSLAVEDAHRACDHHGMTVQEIVLATTATALRRWMLDHDALPTGPLVAAVPVPVRDEEADVGAIRMSPVLLELPTHLREAADRAVAARDAMRSAAAQLDLAAAVVLADLAATPMALPALAARTTSGLAVTANVSANLTITHTTGPATARYLAGARVGEVVPLSALGRATGGLAVHSHEHDGRLDIGLTACREIVPDVWSLVGYLGDALAELLPGG